MVEYRTRYNIITATTPESSIRRPVGRAAGVASRYQLSDMMNLDVPVAEGPVVPSVDDEFKKYVSEISPEGTDMIKFWNVSKLPVVSYEILMSVLGRNKSKGVPNFLPIRIGLHTHPGIGCAL